MSEVELKIEPNISSSPVMGYSPIIYASVLSGQIKIRQRGRNSASSPLVRVICSLAPISSATPACLLSDCPNSSLKPFLIADSLSLSSDELRTSYKGFGVIC